MSKGGIHFYNSKKLKSFHNPGSLRCVSSCRRKPAWHPLAFRCVRFEGKDPVTYHLCLPPEGLSITAVGNLFTEFCIHLKWIRHVVIPLTESSPLKDYKKENWGQKYLIVKLLVTNVKACIESLQKQHQNRK